jgi:GT2 family glycosyltransferase
MESPAPGCNIAFLRTAFERHGLFRTDLGRRGAGLNGGSEDDEFCLRLQRAGAKLIYAPDVVVHHYVPEHRAKKKYFQSWYFNDGRTAAHLELPPEGAVRYFGVPKYLLRNLGEMLLKWMFAPSGTTRFVYKLETYRIAGQVAEMNRLSARMTGLNS